jgi:hypothetical protein
VSRGEKDVDELKSKLAEMPRVKVGSFTMDDAVMRNRSKEPGQAGAPIKGGSAGYEAR